MKFFGQIQSVTGEYPYTVTMKDGTSFKSKFKFSPGSKIKLEFEGEIFGPPWPEGFIHCVPNGMTTYIVSKQSELPPNIRKCLTDGPQKWTSVESFYTYHYSATYDPTTKELTTNWTLRRCLGRTHLKR